MDINTEKILAVADITATYLRALLERGVPRKAAISLASSYMSAILIRESTQDKPREPWEGL